MSSHDIAIEQYDRIDDLIADKLRERQIKIQTMVCQTDLPDRLPARLAVYTFWSLLRLLLMLLGAVALAVAVAFAVAFAVAVAVAVAGCCGHLSLTRATQALIGSYITL